MKENSKIKNLQKLDTKLNIDLNKSKSAVSNSTKNKLSDISPLSCDKNSISNNTEESQKSFFKNKQSKEIIQDKYNEKKIYFSNISKINYNNDYGISGFKKTEDSYKDINKNFIENYEDLISVIGSNKKINEPSEKISFPCKTPNINKISNSCTSLFYVNPLDKEKDFKNITNSSKILQKNFRDNKYEEKQNEDLIVVKEKFKDNNNNNNNNLIYNKDNRKKFDSFLPNSIIKEEIKNDFNKKQNQINYFKPEINNEGYLYQTKENIPKTVISWGSNGDPYILGDFKRLNTREKKIDYLIKYECISEKDLENELSNFTPVSSSESLIMRKEKMDINKISKNNINKKENLKNKNHFRKRLNFPRKKFQSQKKASIFELSKKENEPDNIDYPGYLNKNKNNFDENSKENDCNEFDLITQYSKTESSIPNRNLMIDKTQIIDKNKKNDNFTKNKGKNLNNN